MLANIQQPLCSWMLKPPTWCEYGAPTPEDTPCHRVTYPGGFIHECCDTNGGVSGCTTGPHRAKGDKKVKGEEQ